MARVRVGGPGMRQVREVGGREARAGGRHPAPTYLGWSMLIPGGATRPSERTARTADQLSGWITTTNCHAGNLIYSDVGNLCLL